MAEKVKQAKLRSGSENFKTVHMFTVPQCQLHDEEMRNLLAQHGHPSARVAA